MPQLKRLAVIGFRIPVEVTDIESPVRIVVTHHAQVVLLQCLHRASLVLRVVHKPPVNVWADIIK